MAWFNLKKTCTEIATKLVWSYFFKNNIFAKPRQKIINYFGNVSELPENYS